MSTINEGAEEEDSVYTLVTSLCKKVLEKNDPLPSGTSKHNLGKAHLKKLRSTSFGILLGKTHQDDKQDINAENDMNPMAQLIAYSYHLHASHEKRLGSQLDQCIDEVLSSNLAEDSTFISLIHLMTLLKDTGLGRQDLLRQDPFDLSRIYPSVDAVFKSSSSPGPVPYSTPSPSLFLPPHWMNCHHSVFQGKRYTSQFPFNQKPGEGLQYLSKFTLLFQKDSVTSRPAYNLRTIGTLNGPRGLSFSSPSPRVIVQEDEGYFTPDPDKPPERTHNGISVEDPTEIWSKALQVQEPLYRNWDSRGLPIASQELPYLSAAPPIATLRVWQVVKLDNNILAETSGQQVLWIVPDAKPISRQLFLEHAIYLLQGIESHSFLFKEERDEFVVRPGMWVEGLTPDSVLGLSEDLLICGTYFRRLERMTHRRGFHSEEGTILQALRGSLRRFVQSYRASVLNISAEMNNQGGHVSFYSLIRRIQCLKQQVECLSRLYHLSPGATALPSGIELLPHIYHELCQSMRRSQTCVLYSALTSCCEVYYRRLERWIFLGNCFDDDREEFFVRPDIQFASKRNRLFWTKSFVLNESLVPDFLRGLETTIFQCGRAVHLLRLCNPGHPLCILLEKEHPTIRCSLQMSDLEAVQKECTKFETEVRRVCGRFVTVADIIQETREMECRVQQLIQKSNEERAIAQAAKAAKLARERAAAKQAQLQELKEQMFAAEQRHQAMIERERDEDARFLEEMKRIEEMAELGRQEERAKLLKYYEALNEHIMRRERRVEWRLKRLQLSGRREEFLTDDASRLKEAMSSLNIEPVVFTESVEDIEQVPTDKLIELSDISSEPQSNEPCRNEVLEEKNDFEIEELKTVDGVVSQDRELSEIVGTDYSSCLEAAKEAGVNKRKMMESEFGMTPLQTLERQQDVSTAERGDSSSAAEESAGQAVSNKRKMMGSEFGIWSLQTVEEEQDDSTAKRGDSSSAAEESAGQAAMNKRKMMESEFNVITTLHVVEKAQGIPTDKLIDPLDIPSEPQSNEPCRNKMLEEKNDFEIEELKIVDKVVSRDRELSDIVGTDYSSCLEAAKKAVVQAGVNKRKMMESEFGMTPMQTVEKEQDISTAKQGDSSSAAEESAGQAAMNKRKMMESEFNVNTTSQAVEKVKDLPTAGRKDALSAVEESAVQAALNKHRMMNSEFGMPLPPAIKEGLQAITEAEKNRVSMMKSSCFDTDPSTKPAISQLSDLEKNRRRVLQEEFQLDVTEKSPSKTSVSFRDFGDENMSERLRNKLKVMGEEFDILTGEPRRRHVRISERLSPTVETWGRGTSSETVENEVGTESGEEITAGPVSSDSGFVSATTVAERPKVLQLTSEVIDNETAKMCSSTEDQLSNTSPDRRNGMSRAYSIESSLFKRTPSTPFSMTTSFGTSVTIDGAPLMVDILDRFLGPAQAAPALTPTPSEASGLADVSPSAVWLGTSLQQGLLIPLRTHHGLVSSALLQFFLRDLNLLGHLRSLRSYFFLLDGEFGRRLTSQVFTQMYQVATPAGLLNGLTLNNLLAAALSQSYSGADPNSSLLSFSVSTVPQHFSHSSPGALDCLHLHYRATWPINLILTEEAMDKYNLIFVFLIRLRRVSWLLQEDFIVLKSTARQCNNQQRRDLLNSPEYHQVQIIRHCMSQFVQATQSYVTSAVLQASWTYLEQALQQATTLDHIYNAHIAYIKHVLKRCLLNQNSKRIEAVLNKALSCVLQFHSLVRVRAWQAASTSVSGQRGFLQHPNFTKMVVCFKMFKLQVCKLTCYLEKLVAPPHQQNHLAEFLLLINLKDYYPASEYIKQVAVTTASGAD